MKFATLSFEDAMKQGFTGDNLTEYGDHEYRMGVFKMEGDKPVEMLGCDGGEPEDNTLYRDWGWVTGALNDAYQQGMEVSKRNGLNN